MAFRFMHLFLIAPFSPALAAAVGDPGLVVVIGEIPESVAFQVPGGSPYKFQYDPARFTLWDTVDMQNAFPPGTVFTAGQGVPGCEVDLSDFATLQNCFSGENGGVAAGCAGSNTDADNDIDLEDYATFHATIVGPLCTIQTIPTFVEGLTASTSLSDVEITLLIDPDGDSQFTIEAIQPITILSIDITPASVAIGTEQTVTLQPSIPPFTFDSTTTATWEGTFQPATGPATAPFQVAYSAAQFREFSLGQAVLVVGDGTITDLPPGSSFTEPGTVTGVYVFNMGGMTVRRTLEQGLLLNNAAVWEVVNYPDGPGGLGAPTIAGAWNSLPILGLSTVPDPLNPDEAMLRAMKDFHASAVVRIEGTAQTSLAYSNTTDLSLEPFFWSTGTTAFGFWMGDPVRLTTASCNAAGYEIAVFGLGADFDVHVELFGGADLINLQTGACLDMSPAGSGIFSTAMDFIGVPANSTSLLFVPLSIPLPRELWIYASFSEPDAGWIIAEEPEIGVAPFGDCYASPSDKNGDGTPDICGACFDFDGEIFASFWAEIYCASGADSPSAEAPPTLLVDLVSFDPAGAEIERVEDVVLSKVLGDDGEPNDVVYHNDLSRPIVLVDVDLDPVQYPNVIPFRLVDGGSALIVPATD